MCAKRLVRGGKHVGVIRKTEIIVRTQIDHFLRFPAVGDRGSGICSREKLWLVQFNCPSAELHPVCKARGRLQRVVAFARQEITQTKLCRINIHKAPDSVSLATVCTDGVSPAKLTILCFTRFLTSFSTASTHRGVSCRGSNVRAFGFQDKQDVKE